MRFSLASIAFVLIATSASAEHAKVTLDVESGGKKETAFVDQTPPDSGKNPRPVFKVKAGEMIKIQWTLTNIYPHKTLEDVLVHSFVAKQGKVGQKDLPSLEGDVEMETATAWSSLATWSWGTWTATRKPTSSSWSTTGSWSTAKIREKPKPRKPPRRSDPLVHFFGFSSAASTTRSIAAKCS